MTTSAVYVQDLVWWLPLMAVAAVWFWRRLPWGYVVVGAMLASPVASWTGGGAVGLSSERSLDPVLPDWSRAN